MQQDRIWQASAAFHKSNDSDNKHANTRTSEHPPLPLLGQCTALHGPTWATRSSSKISLFSSSPICGQQKQYTGGSARQKYAENVGLGAKAGREKGGAVIVTLPEMMMRMRVPKAWSKQDRGQSATHQPRARPRPADTKTAVAFARIRGYPPGCKLGDEVALGRPRCQHLPEIGGIPKTLIPFKSNPRPLQITPWFPSKTHLSVVPALLGVQRQGDGHL